MLIDSSGWIEYLRGTGSATDAAVDALIRRDASITTCQPVTMEVLAGGRSESHTRQLERLLARATLLQTEPTDWIDAARLYRTGRHRGLTVRKLVDCLIAAVALRNGEPMLHNDADFDSIAQITTLVASRE
ncbi:PIN domain nuclease [Microbacterium sp.]|uniref:type II toxin-antitoxin system VapC family toxin n=1 Tax=Microbacterium sp. TaxID=51671 RepID=UPI003A8F0BF8